jgi:hypothetical protein
MTQAWQSTINEFQCAECGAVYDVAITRLAARGPMRFIVASARDKDLAIDLRRDEWRFAPAKSRISISQPDFGVEIILTG